MSFRVYRSATFCSATTLTALFQLIGMLNNRLRYQFFLNVTMYNISRDFLKTKRGGSIPLTLSSSICDFVKLVDPIRRVPISRDERYNEIISLV
jgi:hypothetical protein